MGATASPTALDSRDQRLDFWRGLCLIDMVLVHIVTEGMSLGAFFQPLVFFYTRFAAGGFIFIAGLSVGAIFYPRLAKNRWGVYQALLRRAAFILMVHFAAEISFLIKYPLLGREPFADAWQAIAEVMTFRRGTDLLLFYAVVLALVPLALECIRRGYWWIVAAVSVAVFAVGQCYPNALTLPIQHTFLIPLWQLIFMAGLLFGVVLPKLDALSLRFRKTCFVILAAVMVVLSLAAFRDEMGFGLPLFGLSFTKEPLSVGETLRYLAIILTIIFGSSLIWKRIDGGRFMTFVNAFGRHSLAAYVAQAWVISILLKANEHYQLTEAQNLAWALAAVLVLRVFMWVLDAAGRLGGKRPADKKKKKSGLVLYRPIFSAAIQGAVAVGLLIFTNGSLLKKMNAAMVNPEFIEANSDDFNSELDNNKMIWPSDDPLHPALEDGMTGDVG